MIVMLSGLDKKLLVFLMNLLLLLINSINYIGEYYVFHDGEIK